MNLPKIELDQLPDLEEKTGVFGSSAAGSGGGGYSDDRIIALMVYVYTAR